MPGRKNQHSRFVSAAVFIVLEIAAVGFLRTSSTLQDVWVNRASHRVIAWIWGEGERLKLFLSLRENNARLAEENANLLCELTAYRESGMSEGMISHANQRYSYTPAKVVKMSSNTQHNFIILDKGSKDGITPLCGVVTANGAVGIVNSVSDHYCYGLTLTNAGISVSARFGDGGIVAPLVWEGKSTHEAILHGVPLTVQIGQCDTVWTSGHSTIFPSGIPLGIATQKRTNNGATDNVEVNLFLDYANIDYVYIVKNNDAPEMDALEANEEGKR